MSAIRLVLAIWVGKFIAWVCRISGKKGSSLPGVMARKIYPRVLTDLSGQMHSPRLVYMDDKGYQSQPGKIIAVTGTNGKTTVAHMINDSLRVSGHKVVFNREGANMLSGITAAFIASAGAFGRISRQFALLEIDEGSLPGVMAEVPLDIMVVTNFSNDQADRFKASSASEIVKEALAQKKDLWMVLNADDPLAADLAGTQPDKAFFYGALNGAREIEAQFCPRCKRKLIFGVDSHPGKYVCECGFARPNPDLVVLENAVPDLNGLSCRVQLAKGQEYMLRLPALGAYNYYNMAAAFLTGVCLGLNPDRMISGLLDYRPSPGRMESFVYGGKSVLLNLVKNAKGYAETLAVLLQISGQVDVLLALNDTAADGCDVSWIWDVDFERLCLVADKYLRFVCTGLRAGEMAVRLRYAGVAAEKVVVIDHIQTAVKTILDSPGKHIVMLSSYSSLMPLRESLLSMTSKVGDTRAEDMLSIS